MYTDFYYKEGKTIFFFLISLKLGIYLFCVHQHWVYSISHRSMEHHLHNETN